VEHRTFGGRYANERQQPVLYITERCVFTLTPDGLELIEIAPGVDLQRDIVSQMGFAPIIKSPPHLMDARIFDNKPMGLRAMLLRLTLSERFSYDADKNMLFINFEGHKVTTVDDVEAVRAEVDRALSGLEVRPHAIVNYDNFSIAPELIDAYSEMVTGLVARYYSDVTRYTTSSFLRMKLGDALQRRSVATYIYESPEEASSHEAR
jgi:propionate CoA-transferase